MEPGKQVVLFALVLGACLAKVPLQQAAPGSASYLTSTPLLLQAGDPIQVGPGREYQTIADAVAAAQAGALIEIDAGIYTNEAMQISQSDLTLRGIGGHAHLQWGTGDYQTNTSNIENGKGILVISGSNVTIDQLEFSGAKVADANGAGIRYEGGDLTIRNSYFHDNENGILGEGGPTSTLLIEHSVFERNGLCSPCAHNLYIGHMGTLIFRHNKSIDSRVGHTLKSRADVNEIIGNYFSTKNSDGSYEAEFPHGGTVYFVGNIVEQGANTDNSTILAYGFEGSSNPDPALYVINNTFYNHRGSGAFVQTSGSPALEVRNNIFAGGGASISGSGNLDLTSDDFVDVATGNFHLVSDSIAIDAGIDPGSAGSLSLIPAWEYVEPAGKQARQVSGDIIDVGAYEFLDGATIPQDATPPTVSLSIGPPS